MKFKHNKKRNTAFLYEVLIKEMAKATIERNKGKRNRIIVIIKEYFSPSKILGQELKIYKDLNETSRVDLYTAERLLNESRKSFLSLDRKEIFNEQTKLIDLINKAVGKGSFNNFVPNYKNLATIYQVFRGNNSVKEKILLERRLMSTMTHKNERSKDKHMPHVNNLVLKTFINNYNKKYGDNFLEEQKKLLNKYIVSFADNNLELKSYLNEEISRLKTEVNKLAELKDINTDEKMLQRIEELRTLLESFGTKKIDSDLIVKILKIQSLIKEAAE